eukprot:CAMPEP_0185739974 /NCGR_PEP_ID=MMETSP1171-20130828/36677_1 /TAXON_ID=374046 /ORGANISM="Helicotheca tamensis, Strain CCMP826" /LENGTH=164 /DNA_ID=CAMNT_0028411695 /DNA_START=47 /DNA_END=541 /DNA_ORIENTATION=+
MANVQAYKARNIETEYAESKYIALVLAGILQASVICIPLMIVEANNALSSYIIYTLYVFVMSMGILLFMFIPKCIHHRRWVAERAKKKKEKEERIAANTPAPNASEGGFGLKIRIKHSVSIKPGQNVSHVVSEPRERSNERVTEEKHTPSQEDTDKFCDDTASK